jgi:hypothetical protein
MPSSIAGAVIKNVAQDSIQIDPGMSNEVNIN